MRSSLFAVTLLAPSLALAFADPGQFAARPDTPHASLISASSEGLYFTGAPRIAGLTCSACHVGGPGQVRVHVGADDPTLFTDGYNPGQVYEIVVEMQNELEGLDYATGPTCTDPPSKTQKHPYVQCDNNSFALEIDATNDLGEQTPLHGENVYCAAGAPRGGRCPPEDHQVDQVVVPRASTPDIFGNSDVVLGNRTHSTDPTMSYVITSNDATNWRFWWTAPTAGTGPLQMFVAVVDGNGGGGTAKNDQDPFGDDVVGALIPLDEQGGAPAVVPTAGPACSVARARGSRQASSETRGLLLFVVLLAGGAGLGKRRLSRRDPGEQPRH